MSTARTHETMQAYVDALVSSGDFARYLADDVTVRFMGTDRAVRGRDAARQLITFVHQQAFETAVELKLMVLRLASGDARSGVRRDPRR